MPSIRVRRALAIAAPALTLFCLGCAAPAPPLAPPAPASPLWGDMKPVVSVKELMHDMIDPASDFVFDSIGTVITGNRRTDIKPMTDADWARIRFGAVTMAEGAYLLKVPRPFAPAGDNNNSEGPTPLELSPSQIKAKLDKDPVLWNAKIEALRNVNLEVLEIVKKKDVEALWGAADDLDQACENCHLEYWYPSQTALLDQLDKRLEQMHSAGGTRIDK